MTYARDHASWETRSIRIRSEDGSLSLYAALADKLDRIQFKRVSIESGESKSEVKDAMPVLKHGKLHVLE